MKKFLLFAAACVALVACNNKDNVLTNAPVGTSFEKGQIVTLSVNSANQGSQAPGRMMNATDKGSLIEFTWETGDQILVKVGTDTAHFTLSSGAGTAEAEFIGKMPAGGSTFDVQYPIEEPDLFTQACELKTGDIPLIAKNKMLFTASGCTLGTAANMSAAYAILQLNLYGSGHNVDYISCQIGGLPSGITVIPERSVSLSETAIHAKPFYIVLPTGPLSLTFKIWEGTNRQTLSTNQLLEAGQCINMTAKEFSPSQPVVNFTLKTKEGDQSIGELMYSFSDQLLGEKQCEDGMTLPTYLNAYFGTSYAIEPSQFGNYVAVTAGPMGPTIYVQCDCTAEIPDGAEFEWQSEVPKLSPF